MRIIALDRRAFTIVELLVVAAILAVLVSLLLPAVQAAREASRKCSCQNNMRQVGLALLHYEDVAESLPIGATRSITFGHSWLVEIAPYLDQDAAMRRFEKKGPHHGWAVLDPTNGEVVNGLVIPTMICPSSPLDILVTVGNSRVMTPSYVGVSGASAIDPDFIETRVNQCCAPRMDGVMSGGGVLVTNISVPLSQVADGTSQTIAVGEASDFASRNGITYRIDGGFSNGWIMGTSGAGTPPNYTSQSPAWNLVTTRYTPNTRQYGLPGIDTDHGSNNPFISAHLGGVNSVRTDGSLCFLSDTIDLLTFHRLSTRDDGSD